MAQIVSDASPPLRSDSDASAGWGLIFLLCVFSALQGATFGKVIPAIGSIVTLLDVSPLRASWLISAIAASAVVLAPLGGWLGDRFGDRMLLRIALCISAAASLGGVFSNSYLPLLGARLVEGAGFVFAMTAVTALLMRVTHGAQQAAGMAVFSASIPTGIGVAEGLSGLASNFRWAFLGHAIALILALVATVLLPPWNKPAGNISHGHHSLSVYLMANPVRVATALGLTTLAQFGGSVLFPAYAVSTFLLNNSAAAALGAAGMISGIIGSVAAGILLGRGVPRRRIGVASLVIWGVAGVMIFLGPNLTIAEISLMTFCIAGGATTGLLMSLLPLAVPSPDMRAAAGGLMNQINTLGLLVAPPIAFGIFGQLGGPGAAVLVGAASAVTLLLIPFTALARRRPTVVSQP